MRSRNYRASIAQYLFFMSKARSAFHLVLIRILILRVKLCGLHQNGCRKNIVYIAYLDTFLADQHELNIKYHALRECLLLLFYRT